MTYTSRRPRLFVPRNELYVPNMLGNVVGSNSSPAVAALTANRAYYIPFSAPYDTAVKSIAMATTSTTNNYDLGLYDASGTRLGSLGSTAIASAGVKVWTPSTPIGVTADTQYFAAFATNAGSNVYALSASAGRTIFMLIQASAFALPSSWTTPTTNISANTACPILRITFSG